MFRTGDQILRGVQNRDFAEYVNGLNGVEWNEELVNRYQSMLNKGAQESECGDDVS